MSNLILSHDLERYRIKKVNERYQQVQKELDDIENAILDCKIKMATLEKLRFEKKQVLVKIHEDIFKALDE